MIRSIRLAALGTLRDAMPHVSLVAFAVAQDFSAFYILVSRLAQHTMDLRKEKRVSLLISEKDDGRSDPQTLARLTIRGVSDFMTPGEPGYTPVKNLYLARYPASEPLFLLTDFNMVRIIPKGARYIAGLAKAYNLTPEALQKASLRL